MDCHATLPRGHATERTVSHRGSVALRDFNPAYDRNGSDSVIRRSFGDVGSMSGLPESGHGLSDLRVRALISATAPPLRSVARPRPRRPAESEPLVARRRSPTPATVSIAVAGVARRRSLARLRLDQPKKEGPGAGSILGTSLKAAGALHLVCVSPLADANEGLTSRRQFFANWLDGRQLRTANRLASILDTRQLCRSTFCARRGVITSAVST